MHYLTIHYILIVAAFVVALIAAFQWIAAPRINLVAMALALFFLSLLISGCGVVGWIRQFNTDSSPAHTNSK